MFPGILDEPEKLLGDLPASGNVHLTSFKDGASTSKDLEIVVRHLSATRQQVDLSISYCGQGELNLDFLRECPNLVALGLHATRIDLKGIEVCPHMERLEISGSSYSLAEVSSLQRLRKLHIEGNYRDVEALGELRSIESFTSHQGSGGDLKELVGRWTKLQVLDVDVSSWRNMPTIAGFPKLRWLRLGNEPNPEYVQDLSELRWLHLWTTKKLHVTLPNLSGCTDLYRMQVHNPKTLDPILTAPGITSLTIVPTLKFDGKELEQLKRYPPLREFEFRHPDLVKQNKMEAIVGLPSEPGFTLPVLFEVPARDGFVAWRQAHLGPDFPEMRTEEDSPWVKLDMGEEY